MEVTAVYPVDGPIEQSLDGTCNQYVKVTWMTPATGNIDLYLVECLSSLDAINAMVAKTSLSTVLGPLVGDAEYICSVSARNAFGIGPSSQADPFTTL